MQIATTRPKSPKLGRRKNSISGLTNSSEGGGSYLSPRLSQDQNNSNKGIIAKRGKDVDSKKKTTLKSQIKLHSQETVASNKIENKPVESKPNHIGKETEIQKECFGETVENVPDEHLLNDECKVRVNLEPEMNALVSPSSVPEIMSHEVAVGG